MFKPWNQSLQLFCLISKMRHQCLGLGRWFKLAKGLPGKYEDLSWSPARMCKPGRLPSVSWCDLPSSWWPYLSWCGLAGLSTEGLLVHFLPLEHGNSSGEPHLVCGYGHLGSPRCFWWELAYWWLCCNCQELSHPRRQGKSDTSPSFSHLETKVTSSLGWP